MLELFYLNENTCSTIINFVINVKRFNPFPEVPDYFARVIVIISAAVVFVIGQLGVVLVGNILVELVLTEELIGYAFIILHL